MRRQRGTTLIEVMVAGVMAVTIGCGLWLAWSTGYASWNVVQAENNAYSNGRAGIDKMADEIRGATAITAATASSVTVTNSAGQSITYAVTNNNLVRSIGGGASSTVALGIPSLSMNYLLSTGGTSTAPGTLSQVRGATISVAATGGEGARTVVTSVRMRNL